jgi:hypothetical protein
MTAFDQPGIQLPPRSSFVTVVAWIFIILSALSTLIGALQNLMIRSMPFDQLQSALRDSMTAQIPGPARLMFSHFQLLLLATFVLSLLMLISSVGLLRRRNWARLLFMGLLILGIIYMIGGLFVQQSFMSSLTASFNAAAPQDSTFRANEQQFQSIFRVMRLFMIVLSLGIAAVFGWIVARLASPKIRLEFVPRAA